MEIVISHTNTDFDSLASMVALSKVYPKAKLCLAGKLSQEVKNFVSLYRYMLPNLYSKEIDLKEVKIMHIVDTNSKARFGRFATVLNNQGVKVFVYDHHPQKTDIRTTKYYYKSYGSCATIILEMLNDYENISSFEATLFLLGIYSDTNSFSNDSTTERDMYVASKLIGIGANLSIIRDYLVRSFTEEQRELYEDLIDGSEEIDIFGIKLTFSKACKSDYIGELPYLTTKLMEFLDSDIVVSIVFMEDRVHVTCRSRVDSVDLREVMNSIGGGGHKRAASATVKTNDLDGLYHMVKTRIIDAFEVPVRAKDIMNYPVKTVYDDLSISEVNNIMLRYGHTGMPVLKRGDETLVGIISRTDVDKAIVHKLGHAPVKGFMSTNVITVKPDSTLVEIQKTLIDNNIGRVPVIEGDVIIGIVTRTNVINTLYGTKTSNWYKVLYNEYTDSKYSKHDINLRIEGLAWSIKKVLYNIRGVSKELDCKAYVVGGFVRDLLLNITNSDIDVVVEGDAVDFAKYYAQKHHYEVITYEPFKTASVKLNSGHKIDFVTARREYYSYPGALPTIEKGTLWADLFRRDFTINCMAISLCDECFGDLVDFFGGERDIEARKIRVLYNLSFLEDPTRIFRALRFEGRYGYSLESETERFLRYALDNDALSSISKERIKHEFELIFKEKNSSEILRRLIGLGVLKSLFSSLEFDSRIVDLTDQITHELRYKGSISDYNDLFGIFLEICVFYNSDAYEEEVEKFIKFWNKTNNECIRILKLYYNFDKNITSIKNSDIDALVKIFKAMKPSDALVYEVISGSSCIKEYNEFINIRYFITGKDIEAIGLKAGPYYQQIFKEILKLKLKGKIKSKEDELEVVKCFVRRYNGT